MGAPEKFIEQTLESFEKETFVKLTLTNYVGAEDALKKITARPILIKGVRKLSFTYTYKTRDIVKNYDAHETATQLGAHLKHFKAATLMTTEFDLSYPAMKRRDPAQTDAPDGAHDRSKTRHVETAGKAYLHALGITDADGKVYKNAQDKYKQIDKYVELAAAMIGDADIKTIVDMGAGKGYLTFALYDYLKTQGRDVAVTGVEMRKDLVDICNKIARDHGMSGLSFVEGTIAGYDPSGADMLIALHACDTATDDAIAKGIKAAAKIILTAPCCHKQVRRALAESHAEKSKDFGFMLRHGIFMERQAEMLTDALRALYLEREGYKVKAFEFISDAHTPKNVMIAAVKDMKASGRTDAPEKIMAAKNLFGLSRHHLEDLLR